MRFMLDTIKALRTNNVRKIPNYDPSLLEHMKKLLRRFVRSTGASLPSTSLPFPFLSSYSLLSPCPLLSLPSPFSPLPPFSPPSSLSFSSPLHPFSP